MKWVYCFIERIPSSNWTDHSFHLILRIGLFLKVSSRKRISPRTHTERIKTFMVLWNLGWSGKNASVTWGSNFLKENYTQQEREQLMLIVELHVLCTLFIFFFGWVVLFRCCAWSCFVFLSSFSCVFIIFKRPFNYQKAPSPQPNNK